WRFGEQLAVADKAIFVSGRQTKDSTFSTYLLGQTVVRKYLALRGGLVLSQITESGAGAPSTTGRAAYFGISRNQLANDSRGALGLRWVKTLAVDLLVGTS